jgi:hypothetical protein
MQYASLYAVKEKIGIISAQERYTLLSRQNLVRTLVIKSIKRVAGDPVHSRNLQHTQTGAFQTNRCSVSHALSRARAASEFESAMEEPWEQVPVWVFVSYTYDDERQRKQLDAMLNVLEQYHGLTSWQNTADCRRRMERREPPPGGHGHFPLHCQCYLFSAALHRRPRAVTCPRTTRCGRS